MCKLTIQENTKHMKTRRIMAVVLAALMMLSIIPVAFAEEISSISADAALSVRMDDAWAAIELAEAEALADNLPASDVINAVYTAALNNENVDADSFSDFTADGFFFTVNGMHCAYNYRLRNKIEANVTEEGSVTFNASNGKVVEMRDATSPNVLLVGPYYGGYDPTFTDQYRREATSIAEATGGTLTILAGHDATGPAIAPTRVLSFTTATASQAALPLISALPPTRALPTRIMQTAGQFAQATKRSLTVDMSRTISQAHLTIRSFGWLSAKA